MMLIIEYQDNYQKLEKLIINKKKKLNKFKYNMKLNKLI